MDINISQPSNDNDNDNDNDHDNDNDNEVKSNPKFLKKSLIFVTDWHPNILSSTTIGKKNNGAVMYIGPDSLALIQHFPQSILTDICDKIQKSVFKNKTIQILDFCSGSGVQAIVILTMLEQICQTITTPISLKVKANCFDVNERALRFIRFNSILNGFEKNDISIQIQKMDLLDENDKQTVIEKYKNSSQMILANPPFIPVPSIASNDSRNNKTSESIYKRYGLFSSGGNDGEDVLREIIMLAPLLLNSKTGGFLGIVSEFMNPSKSSEIVYKMKQWWKKRAPFHSKGIVKGLLFTNEFPVDTATYASRRSNDEFEYKVWYEHLNNLDIETISPGLLFVQMKDFDTNPNNKEIHLELEHLLVPRSELGSIWTPHNKYAVEFTKHKWKELNSS